MMRLLPLLLLFSVLSACSQHSAHEPSARADVMAGVEGKLEIKPNDWIPGETTFWKDTDGVDPGTAGCHVGTDGDGQPNDRMFAEACLPDGRLVETSPSAGQLHRHRNDIGRPYKFDCNAWCIGNGSSEGRCEVAKAPPCGESARCVCN
jgi:hypothetical protein